VQGWNAILKSKKLF